MLCWTRAERTPDTEQIISDDEDEELQELMREETEDGLLTNELTPADQSCKPESAASLAKTPHTPESYIQVLLASLEVLVNMAYAVACSLVFCTLPM